MLKSLYSQVAAFTEPVSRISHQLAANRRTIDVFRVGTAFVQLLTLIATPQNILFFVDPLADESTGVQCNAPLSSFTLWCLNGDETTWTNIASVLYAVVLIAVISGIAPAITSWLHWYVSVSLILNSNIIDGGDQLLSNLLFLTALISINDNRLFLWKKRAANSNPDSLRTSLSSAGFLLFILQLAAVYAHSTIAKLSVPQWTDGSAIWYWLQAGVVADRESSIIHSIIFFIIQNPVGSTLLTYGTLVLQTYLLLALFLGRRARSIALALGVVFHLGIAVMMGLWSFSIIMILAELVVYVRGNEASTYHRFLTRRLKDSKIEKISSNSGS